MQQARAKPGAGSHSAVPYRLIEPTTEPPWPLVIYSHGLGGNLHSGATWSQAWKDAGFACLHVLHAPTSDAIFDLASPAHTQELVRLSLAINHVPGRCHDIGSVLDQLFARGSAHASKLDSERIAVAGHSYGALTVMALAGRSLQPSLRDHRIRAALALSPGVASAVGAKSMAPVRIPMLCATGSFDDFVEIGLVPQRVRAGVPLPNRMAVFEALPPGNKRLLFVDGADHMTFAGEAEVGATFSRAGPWLASREAERTELIRVQTTNFLVQWARGAVADGRSAGRAELQGGYLITG
jgi:predicted dienelactone hydrolase